MKNLLAIALLLNSSNAQSSSGESLLFKETRSSGSEQDKVFTPPQDAVRSQVDDDVLYQETRNSVDSDD